MDSLLASIFTKGVFLGLLLLSYTAAVTVFFVRAWKWAKRKRREFAAKNPNYRQRRNDQAASSTEEFFFAEMPSGWFSTWSAALGVALVGGLVVFFHELLGR